MSDDPITFRRLRPEDAAILDTVAPGTFDNPVRPGYLAPFLAEDGHEMVVALAGDTVVGMISAVVCYHPDKPAQLWINEVGTADAWRRRGIAFDLVNAMVEIGWQRGCDTIWLGTEEDNLPARGLYRKAGAREVAGLVVCDWGAENAGADPAATTPD